MSEAILKDNDLDVELVDKIMNFEPLITMEEIEKAEKLEKDRSRQRRVMLAGLTKSSKELFSIAEESPEVAEDMFHIVNGYLDTLKALTRMTEACGLRLLASLSCVDDNEKFKALSDEWKTAISTEGVT